MTTPISPADMSYSLVWLSTESIMSVTYCSLHHSTCILSERKSEITAISCLIKHIHTQQYRTYLCRTYTHLMAFFPGLPGWAGTRKVKPIWILLKQETVSGSDISWDICKSASRSRQITMPVPHHSSFLQTGCPSCRPTNSVKALKASPCKVLKNEFGPGMSRHFL